MNLETAELVHESTQVSKMHKFLLIFKSKKIKINKNNYVNILKMHVKYTYIKHTENTSLFD